MDHNDRNAAWDHAWKHFSVHASQRMSVFNFYLVLVGLLTTGLVKTLDKDFPRPWFGCVLGLSLVMVSFIFWRFDQRTRFLVKRAEDALKALEDSVEGYDSRPELRIFTTEAKMTTDLRVWYWPTTYTDCLRLMFATFATIGLIGMLVALHDELKARRAELRIVISRVAELPDPNDAVNEAVSVHGLQFMTPAEVTGNGEPLLS